MKEKEYKTMYGMPAFILLMIILLISIGTFILGCVYANSQQEFLGGAIITTSIIVFIVTLIFMGGAFIVQPNEAVVLLFFGDYRGTVKKCGWHFANPFLTHKKISLKSRNLNGEKLKVNDEMGNPIEIAAVVVWRVDNALEALFQVENYTQFVNIQSESAIRHLAGMYPYDITDSKDEISLRGNTEIISEALKNELQERLTNAGVLVEEARLSHLAYAPEIAAAMLQRQQASAMIAARQKIVEGAVGMVEMALQKLSEKAVVELDEERKAAMVSNLLVVLCGDRNTQPVINTGTLHN